MATHVHIYLQDAEKTGAWTIAARQNNAIERFLSWAQEIGGLTRTQAEKAFSEYKKAKAVKIDMTGGQFTLTHGGFGERNVLRRAAGLKE